MGQAVDSFTPLRPIDNDNLSSMKACLSTFKSHVELEPEKLSTRLSIQNQIINANKQELDTLITENLHLKSRIGELENRAPFQYEGPVNTVHIEVRKENQASADNNDYSSNTCPCHNAPQLLEPTSTMPPTTCQNQQQVSSTDRSHLNDGDLILPSTDRDTNQQSYDHALCANGLQLPIPTRIRNRVSSQQQKRKLRGKFRKEFNHNYNQVFRKRLPSSRTFRQPKYPRPTQTQDPSTFSRVWSHVPRRGDWLSHLDLVWKITHPS